MNNLPKKKPRVCMVVQQDYYSDGRLRRYAESLADSGASVDVLCVRSEEGEEATYRNDIRIYQIPVHHGNASLVGYLFEYAISFAMFTLYLLPLHLKRRYDVIHIHNIPDFLVFCGFVPRLLGAKVILDIHDPMPEFFLSKYARLQDGLFVKMLRFQEWLSAKFASRVITANDNFKNNLITRGTPGTKITVVNNIADVSVFDRNQYPRKRTSAPDDRFVLLYPGTLAPRYGLELPIRAVAELRQHIPNLLLRIVGPHNDHVDELKALVAELVLQDHVEILPVVPIHEVPAFMAQADVGIYTAYPDPHMSIATPTKVLEYVQMGLPVIASRLLILEQYFGDDSIRFFTAGDADEFIAAVLEMSSDPAKRDSLSEHADEDFVRQHCWANERAKYFVLLNELMKVQFFSTSSSPPPRLA